MLGVWACVPGAALLLRAPHLIKISTATDTAQPVGWHSPASQPAAASPLPLPCIGRLPSGLPTPGAVFFGESSTFPEPRDFSSWPTCPARREMSTREAPSRNRSSSLGQPDSFRWLSLGPVEGRHEVAWLAPVRWVCSRSRGGGRPAFVGAVDRSEGSGIFFFFLRYFEISTFSTHFSDPYWLCSFQKVPEPGQGVTHSSSTTITISWEKSPGSLF